MKKVDVAPFVFATVQVVYKTKEEKIVKRGEFATVQVVYKL